MNCSKCGEWLIEGVKHVCSKTSGSTPRLTLSCTHKGCKNEAFRAYNICGELYCQEHYMNYLERTYDITPNDKTARFMIKMGKDSNYVKKATQEQRLYAVRYFKQHGYPEPTLQDKYNDLQKVSHKIKEGL